MTIYKIILSYLLIINTVSFIMFGIDKFSAVRGWWRISEKSLLGSAFLGGSLGAFLGMHLFRHKTNLKRKPAFAIGVPLMLILHAGLLIYFGWIR